MVTAHEEMEAEPTPNAISIEDTKLRNIKCELNPLSRPDGSAMFAQGDTCVLASMIGPIEASMKNLNIEQLHVDCTFRPKAGIPTIKDKLRECIIKDTCSSALIASVHPRTTVAIQVQELDDRCGLDACAINAACMALMVGAIPMKFTIAAVHCIVDKDGKVILDPDRCQAIGSVANFTFVFDSLEHNLVTVNTGGRFQVAQFNEAELMSREASKIIFEFQRKLITKFRNKKFTNDSATLKKQPKVDRMDEV